MLVVALLIKGARSVKRRRGNALGNCEREARRKMEKMKWPDAD